MSDRSVTLNRTCFTATADQVVLSLISPPKAIVGFAIVMGWYVGGTALLPEPQGQAGLRESMPESPLRRNRSDRKKR